MSERARAAAVRLAPLLVVLVLAGGLRLHGTEWDAGAHLHPDERYMSLVAAATELPDSVGSYLDPARSPLSPYRTEAGRDYLYGTLPLFTTKAVASAVGRDDYDALHLVGRRLSALLDLLTVLVVFLVARRIVALRLAVIAAAFYGTSVVAIQHAHFFTVDSWLTAFFAATLAAAGALAGTPRSRRRTALLVATGALAGLTVACKPTGLLVAVPLAVALPWGMRRPRTARQAATASADVALDALITAVPAYVAFRAVSPYAFATGDWLDLRPNPQLRAALEAQASAVAGESMAPPNLQWLLSTPVVDPLANLLLWGLPAVGLLGLLGLVLVAGKCRRRPDAVLAAVAVLVVLGWFTPRFVHALRYLLPAVPALCVLAALALSHLAASHRRTAAVTACAALAVGGVWALAYTSIYRRPHTRVAAAEWVESHVPRGSRIAFEHWDDPLPLDHGAYRVVTVPVFDADGPGKADRLYDALSAADVYVLSSPRAWWTAGRLPERFPVTAGFYRGLFAGRLGFDRVATFRSDPRLLGVTIRDTAAEEAQWVYDHPPVVVFRRSALPSREEFRRRLRASGAEIRAWTADAVGDTAPASG